MRRTEARQPGGPRRALSNWPSERRSRTASAGGESLRLLAALRLALALLLSNLRRLLRRSLLRGLGTGLLCSHFLMPPCGGARLLTEPLGYVARRIASRSGVCQRKKFNKSLT